MENNYYHFQPAAFYTPPRPKPIGTGRDSIFAALFLFGCIIAVDFGLFGGFHLGHTVAALFLSAVYFFYGKGKRFTAYSLTCLLLAALDSVVFAVYPDSGLHFFLYVQFFILLAVSFGELYEINRYSVGGFRTVADWGYILFVCPFRFIGDAFGALLRGSKTGKSKSVVFLGLLCAVPVLAVILPLLIRADAAFQNFFAFLSIKSLPRLIGAILLGLILFLFLFSHAFGVTHYKGLVQKSAPVISNGKVPTAGLVAFTGAISFFYLLYLFSQLSYFFDAFAGQMPTAFLPAEYARRGFFEMFIICVINLILLSACILLSKRESGKIPRPLIGTGAFIIFFSLVLIATALSKMVLYIRRFGMTHRRIETTVFMVMLALVMMALLIRLFCRKFPYVKMAVLCAAIVLTAAGFADPDTVIARYNVNAYQSGKLSTLDFKQLKQLGEGATPYIIQLMDDKDSFIAGMAKYELKNRYGDFAEGKEDFRSFTFTNHRNRALLNERKDEFISWHDLSVIEEMQRQGILAE